MKVENTTFETMSRSGIWYTKNISIKNSALQAPKLFRRTSHIILDNVHFANAEETMWTCNDIKITNSQINGDYFGKDSQNIYLDHVSVIGNYVFDGAENIEVHNSQIEIDAGYEGLQKLALIEAKRDLSIDFLVRQLYYPFRTWKDRG